MSFSENLLELTFNTWLTINLNALYCINVYDTVIECVGFLPVIVSLH